MLTEGMRLRTSAEWLEILTAADVPCGAANTLADLLDNDYLRDTDFFQQAEHPIEGAVTVMAIPAEFSASPPNVHRLWPSLGQHTEEVLREIGYDTAEIAGITGAR
jgi:crotonobetainyl-CoA:carnitine CoA-transferase CaiB-like acyl-CoA transferase